MTILEFPKDDLLALSDVQLEQLIGRLAEAEVSAYGASVADVRFSGSITAPDGGVEFGSLSYQNPSNLALSQEQTRSFSQRSMECPSVPSQKR